MDELEAPKPFIFHTHPYPLDECMHSRYYSKPHVFTEEEKSKITKILDKWEEYYANETLKKKSPDVRIKWGFPK